MKLEQLVSYFRDGAINLSPAFQRGKVWTPKLRTGLLSNILNGKPIPAVFLYKKSRGSKIEYVILDGKQRLESILLYIGNQRKDLKIENWKEYIFGERERKQSVFKAEINGEKKTLAQLENEEIINFRDYVLPIIEIDFEDSATLEGIIQLFVDINQYGVRVSRFDIVKALNQHNPLLTQVFKLVAEKQRRGKDNIYRIKKNCIYVRIFKRLDLVQGADENKIDIMWEKLLEFALFVRTSLHRKPVQILKEFISQKKGRQQC